MDNKMKSTARARGAFGIWLCALAVFYLTVAVIVVWAVLNQIAKATNQSAGLFDEWYQTLLFCLDLVAVLGLGGCIALYAVTRRRSGGVRRHKELFYSFYNRTIWGGITAFFAILTLIVYVGSVIANQYQSHLNSLFGVTPYDKVDIGEDVEQDTNYYPSDYYKADGSLDDIAMRNHSMQVAEEAATESTVLLWNNGNALPLARGAKVGVFGMTQVNQHYLFTGIGSGKLNPVVEDTMVSALADKGFEVYQDLYTAHRYSSGTYGNTEIGATSAGMTGLDAVNYEEARINEIPWDALNGTVVGNVTEATDKYKDAAIVVFSRIAGEGTDVNFNDGADVFRPDSCFEDNYLDLSKNEADLLAHLKAYREEGRIDRIILLINSANPLQFKHIKEYGIDACLWVGEGGNASFRQIANVLSGTSPSGRLVDTFLYDNYAAPATENFGNFVFTETGAVPENTNYAWNTKYIVYQEGIYVGYRYFETRYEDHVLGSGNADSAKGVKAGSGNWNYSDEVAYPFGHGLSYTTFSYGDMTVTEAGGDYTISVPVTNTGSAEGKEVVQIYLQKPYTDYDREHGIEKAAVELVGFAKTGVLYPSSQADATHPNSETVKVTVPRESFKTYDADGEGTYILEKGDYYLAAGKNAHDAVNNVLAEKYALKKIDDTQKARMDAEGNAALVHPVTVAADDFTTYSVSSATGAEIHNLFDDVDINRYEGTADQRIAYLSRSDWDATYPAPISMKCVNPVMVADMQYSTPVPEEEGDEMPKYGTVSEEYGYMNLLSMKELDYDDPLWEVFMDQTTWEEQSWLVTYGSHAIAGAESVSAPGGFNQNGPSGINQPNPTLGTQMAFPSEINLASTFNRELVNRVGDAFGMEMIHVGYCSLNGLGANIHRTAYSGRCWEYYSEDGYLSGEMLAEESSGLQERGVILFTKHFLLNDQERNRGGAATFANEQAIREIYAKAFEAAVTRENLNGFMSSFGRVGCTWAGRHKGLLTDLPRTEWGFTGTIETDAAVARYMLEPEAMANAVMAGQDLWLWGGSRTVFDAYKDNPTFALALREAARRVLYGQLHSNAINGLKTTTRIVVVKVWWQKALETLEIVIPVALAASAVMLGIAFFLASKRGKAWVEAPAGPTGGGSDGSSGSNGPDGSNSSGGSGSSGSSGEPPKGASGGSDPKGPAGSSAKTGSKKFNPKKIAVTAVSILLALAVVITAITVPVVSFRPTVPPVTGGSGGSGETPPAHEHVDADNDGFCDECNEPMTPTPSTCLHQCPVCGLCVDLSSDNQNPDCAHKCGEGKAHSCVFEAESKQTVLEGSGLSKTQVSAGKVDYSTQEPVGYLGGSFMTGASITFPVTAEKAETVTLRIRIGRASGQGYRFTDKILLQVNADIVESPLLIPQATPGSGWFDFGTFIFGCIDLKEGENTVRLTGIQPSGNVDYIEFLTDQTIKWSDGSTADRVDGVVTNPPEDVGGGGTTELVNINTSDDDAGWTQSQSFDAVTGTADSYAFAEGVTAVTNGGNVAANRPNDRNVLPVANLINSSSKEAYLTFCITSDKAEKVGIYAELNYRAKEASFGSWAQLVVNGTAFTSDAVMPAGAEFTPTNSYTKLGFIELKEGLNTITFKVITTDVSLSRNVYGIRFTSESAQLSWGEATKLLDRTTDDSGWQVYDDFAAVDESEQIVEGVKVSEGTNIPNRPNDRGLKPIGNLNAAGKWVTFLIHSSKSARVGLYAEFDYGYMPKQTHPFSDWATLTVNGKDFTSDAELLKGGIAFSSTNEYLLLGFIDLVEGDNTITFTVTQQDHELCINSARNIYGLKLTAESAELSWGEDVVTPERTPTSITLNTDSVQKTFRVGDRFTYEGLSVTAHYGDEPTEETVTSGFTVSAPDMNEPGQKTVTVTYKEQTATYEITVTQDTEPDPDDSEWQSYVFDAVTDGKLHADVTTSSGVSVKTNHDNARGKGYLGDLQSAGKYVEFHVNASAAGKAGLYAEFGYGLKPNQENTVDQWVKIVVNGRTYISHATYIMGGTAFTPTNQYLLLGFVDLAEGENTIRFEVIDSGAEMNDVVRNFYGIKLTAESAVIDWKSGEEPAGPTLLDRTTDDSEWTVYEHFDVDNGGSIHPDVKSSTAALGTNRNNERGKGFLGSVQNVGNYIEFRINASVAGKVGLYAELGYGLKPNQENTVDQWVKIVVNGTEYTSDAQFLTGGNAFTPTNTYLLLGFVDLKAGENTIRFEVIDAGAVPAEVTRNFYGLKFTSESAVVKWQSEAAAAASLAPAAALPANKRSS